MAKAKKKQDMTEAEKAGWWLETTISVIFGLAVIGLLGLFGYVIFTQVILAPK